MSPGMDVCVLEFDNRYDVVLGEENERKRVSRRQPRQPRQPRRSYVVIIMAVVLASFAAVVPFESLTRPSHIDNKTWYGYRLENVVYHAHSRVHAVALLLDRDWHDGTCEQAAAAGLWFDYVGKACNVWMRVLASQDEGSVEEDVVLHAREVMRVIDDSWQNLRHMTGRRDPAAQAFGDDSRFTATVPVNGVQFEDPGALIGFMWRTVLYAHANVSTSQHNTSAWKAVRDTYLDAVAYEPPAMPPELAAAFANADRAGTGVTKPGASPLETHFVRAILTE